MRRITISRKLRLAVIWLAAFTLLLGFRYEMDYRARLSRLPTLVDAEGNTASIEAAMAGLDSYARAKQIRTYGFISLGVGVILVIGAVGTTHHSDLPRS